MKSLVKPYVVVCLVGLFAVTVFIAACQPAANTNVNMNISANANLTPVKRERECRSEPFGDRRARTGCLSRDARVVRRN